MVELWFALLAFMLTMFVVLDGRNIGAGALHLIVAKTDLERREVIAAIGPLWSWHEVWLVAAGGTFVLAFPAAVAASFSGFYLALWLLVWALILRGISIEVGGHVHDAMWQTGWDVVFAVANVMLAAFLGTAFGNVIRGVPLDHSKKFSMPFFTDFGVHGQVGLLDWYTLSVAVLALVLLTAHGATYLTLKTKGRVHDRSEYWARRLWCAGAVLIAIVSVQTFRVRPELLRTLLVRVGGWGALVALPAGAALVWTGLARRHERRAFAGSCLVIAALLAGAAAGAFPVLLRSTIAADYSMTAFDGATSTRGLTLALMWWPLALILALVYFALIGRNYRGKVQPAEDTQGSYDY